jgi:hypothetical protein
VRTENTALHTLDNYRNGIIFACNTKWWKIGQHFPRALILFGRIKSYNLYPICYDKIGNNVAYGKKSKRPLLSKWYQIKTNFSCENYKF